MFRVNSVVNFSRSFTSGYLKKVRPTYLVWRPLMWFSEAIEYFKSTRQFAGCMSSGHRHGAQHRRPIPLPPQAIARYT